LACASCHPEGGDDGSTWDLSGEGQLRTQSLRGGVAGTEPLHWRGEHGDFNSLAEDVMFRGMQGPKLHDAQVVALERLINAIPAWKAPVVEDRTAVGRGRAVFENAAVTCATCHSGPRLTNNETVDVGTGGEFQVPSLLGLSRRAPFMHNGCAPNLTDRFTDCGGGDAHGAVSQLAPADFSDLITYLGSL